MVQEVVYGDVSIEKLECVGHVQKRLGSRLRSLKRRLGKTPVGDGKGIGGAGRLTKNRINKLQVYFGKAIRQNTHSIMAMQNAVIIMANLQMKIQTMNYAQKEKTLGVDSKGISPREHQIMSTESPHQRQWQMLPFQHLKLLVRRIFSQNACMVERRTKMRQ